MPQLFNRIAPSLTALWHWRWPGMAVAWFVCLAGWSVIALLPGHYTVRALLAVETGTIVDPERENKAPGLDAGREVEMIRGTLFSSPSLAKLVEETGIDRHRNVTNMIERAALIDDLSREITLKAEGRDRLVIQFSDNDPDMAMRVVDAMATMIVTGDQERTRPDTTRASAVLEQQIGISDEKLRGAELEVLAFKRDHDGERVGLEQRKLTLDRAESELRSLRAKMNEAISKRDQIDIELDAPPEHVPALHPPGTMSNGEKYLEALKQELSRQRLLHAEKHPDITSLSQLIIQATQQLEAPLNDNGSSPSPGVENLRHGQLSRRLEVADASVQDFRRRLEAAKLEVEGLAKKARQSPKADADLKRLIHDHDVLLQQHQQLVRRRDANERAGALGHRPQQTDQVCLEKMAQNQQDSASSTESSECAGALDTGRRRAEYRMIEPPVRPVEPSAPSHGQLVIAVMIAGIGAGCALALLRFSMTGTVFTTAQLQAAFSTVPVLGGVTRDPRRHQRGRRSMSRLGMASAAMSLVTICGLLFYFHEINALTLKELLPNSAFAQDFVNKVSVLVAGKDARASF